MRLDAASVVSQWLWVCVNCKWLVGQGKSVNNQDDGNGNNMDIRLTGSRKVSRQPSSFAMMWQDYTVCCEWDYQVSPWHSGLLEQSGRHLSCWFIHLVSHCDGGQVAPFLCSHFLVFISLNGLMGAALYMTNLKETNEDNLRKGQEKNSNRCWQTQRSEGLSWQSVERHGNLTDISR